MTSYRPKSSKASLILAGRKSDLARLQVYLVAEKLRCTFPELEIRCRFRESLGDKNLSDPLWQMPEKGVFTEDFVADLVEGSSDVVVHSWKDLPTEPRPETRIAATLPRADPRDLFLFRAERAEPVQKTRRLLVLSSSPRRAYNLEPLLAEALPFGVDRIEFAPVRGNVCTRMKKLFHGGADALIIAKAALDRLLSSAASEFEATRHLLRSLLARCWWMVLPLQANPTAPGQGALALEVARGRDDLEDILATINDSETYENVEEERRLLAAYGGGCHQKIGVSVLSRPYGRILSVKGETEAGTRLSRSELLSSQPPLQRTSLERIWPLEPQDAWFDRELLPSATAPSERALWIAKSEGLPADWSVPPEQIVWTSGLATWKKLARRGVWVHGSAESLGEDEDPAIGTLAGRALRWLKLTHENGYDDGSREILATYRLTPCAQIPCLKGKTHYYWTSGSGFLRALGAYPEIRDGWHACGPGNTYRMIRKTLGDSARIRIALDHASWLAHVTEGPRPS